MSLLGGQQTGSAGSTSEKLGKAEPVAVVQMPDLIDTGDPDDFPGTGNSEERQNEQIIGDLTSAPPPLIDALFGDGPSNMATANELKNDDGSGGTETSMVPSSI